MWVDVIPTKKRPSKRASRLLSALAQTSAVSPGGRRVWIIGGIYPRGLTPLAGIGHRVLAQGNGGRNRHAPDWDPSYRGAMTTPSLAPAPGPVEAVNVIKRLNQDYIRA